MMTLTACSGPEGTPVGQSPTGTGAAGTEPAATQRVPTATPVPVLPPGTGFTLVATGDVLLHTKLVGQARQDAARTGQGKMDFAPMMSGVRPYLRGADLGVCHLETPLADASGPFHGYPSFSGPPQVVPALRATGYDVCSTASNHIFDQGAVGVRRTLNALDAGGIAHAGSARTRAESRRITNLTANGVKVAFLSYTYGFNGGHYPGGDSWRANKIDVKRIVADARRARSGGAQAVVLAMHWGTEYLQEANAQQREAAAEVARSGLVDLIIGHHAHVVQPVQRIGRTWVVYGLGNFIANYLDVNSANAEGLLVRFTFTRTQDGRIRVTKAEYVPLFMTQAAPRRVLDVREALRTGEFGTSDETRLRKALRRTTRVVDSMDGAEDGLRLATPLG